MWSIAMVKITVIAGGTGSVKLVRGLAQAARTGGGREKEKKDDLAVIANVGDNIWLYGLYVCPDIDTVVYGLGGMLDEKRGWGVRGDTFSFLDQVAKVAPAQAASKGEKPWFSLGDRDLAMHVLRTAMLREGKSLSEVTAAVAKRLGIREKIIPATDDDVQTMISAARAPGGADATSTTTTTTTTTMHLQEFWVKNQGRPAVLGVQYRGIEKAKPSADAMRAIRDADMVIIAPGNPVSSIGPTVALAGLRQELARARDRVVAVSPMIGNRAVSGPAAKYMKAVGLPSSPEGVARYYQDFAGTLVISESDSRMSGRIEGRTGMRVRLANITMKSSRDEVALARYLLGRR